MTPERLKAYRRLRSALLRTGTLTNETGESLRDMGEALLLTAEHVEAAPVEREAALTLSRLVGEGLLTDASAETLWLGIEACGPNATQSAGKRRSPSKRHSRQPSRVGRR
jgi:hypothetical protein